MPSLTRSPRSRTGRVVAGATAAMIGLLAATAGVAAHGPDPVLPGGSRWAQDQALAFAWRSGSVPASGYQAAIMAAADDASTTRGSRAATFAYASGALNLIGYGLGATCGPNGIACFSRNAPTSFSMWMREQGHRFDWGSLRWCQAYTTWPDGCYDVENIMLDEFGHVEILDHHGNYANEPDYTDAVVQALSRTKPTAGWDAHGLGRCDVATLQMQYDMDSWGSKYSTCLDLSTTLVLTASPSTVTGLTAVTLTATLKVADDPSYVRLALNPIALRTITLQRRPKGISSWTSVGTMPHGATSGTYTKTQNVSANTEFRAVFSKPADEGLHAATSPIVTILAQ
jgi:hypothetical protein